ncbi:GNAT family N-acetyltransferase [Idiomarina sp. M1R2S28]|uniref:GNAT family N-acetyltransferase n=1 Tax=Idiomarina rhizosphaerae TaxID=2961572 RepID=A0A9X2FXK8_9GAMM|nr:N-acetyltransferase [Idiomarina rhizosphaerae]MCP1339339.1 GNAT family N-acetyltransferase [Idiomarina rhizosphaerae]
MNTEFRIERADKNDLEQLVSLERATFNYSCISRRSFKRVIESNHNYCWVARSGNDLAGYAIAFTRRNSKVWRLYSIAVAQSFRGLGVGNLLMNEVLNSAKSSGAVAMSLEVKSDNKAAIHWYQSCGFETIDILPEYYDDGSDGFKMRFTFCPESQ